MIAGSAAARSAAARRPHRRHGRRPAFRIRDRRLQRRTARRTHSHHAHRVHARPVHRRKRPRRCRCPRRRGYLLGRCPIRPPRVGSALVRTPPCRCRARGARAGYPGAGWSVSISPAAGTDRNRRTPDGRTTRRRPVTARASAGEAGCAAPGAQPGPGGVRPAAYRTTPAPRPGRPSRTAPPRRSLQLLARRPGGEGSRFFAVPPFAPPRPLASRVRPCPVRR